MLDLQEKVTQAQLATAGRRRDAADKATREYLAVLDSVPSRTAGDFDAARARASGVLKQHLLSAAAIASIAGEAKLDENAVAQIALAFDAMAHPLSIPEPITAQETRTGVLALAGAAGAVGGMLALAPLLRLTVDMRDLGLLLGGPIGAWLAVLIVQRMARLRLLRRLFARRRTLQGAACGEYNKTVRIGIEQYVNWVVSVLALLCACRSSVPQAGGDVANAMRKIGRLIASLHQATPDSLPVVAHELIQQAKNSGFAGLEGLPRFLEAAAGEEEIRIWKPDLQSQYEAFGHIVEGDRVVVERPPVIFGGQVVQRGLVRKVRDRA